MMRSFFRLLNVDPGLDSTNVLTIGMPIATERFPDPARLNQYLREIRTAVEAVPGVRETALQLRAADAGHLLRDADAGGRPPDHRSREPAGRVLQGGEPVVLHARWALSSLRGRALSDRDVKSAPPVLVINERLATREFPNQDPIGQRLLIQEIIPGKTGLGPEIAWEIVGVVRDEKVQGMADDRSAGVYVSNEQSPVYFMTLSVRAHADPLPLQKSISAAIHSVNKDQALNDIRTVDQIKELSMAANRLQTTLLGDLRHHGAAPRRHRHLRRDLVFGGAAHARDRGSRRAGRERSSLLRMVLGRGLVLTGVGLAIGLGGALGLTRLMATILYGVGARDPATLVSVAAVLAAVAAAACLCAGARGRRRWTRWWRLRYE